MNAQLKYITLQLNNVVINFLCSKLLEGLIGTQILKNL
jgi:hypothetical protein